MGGILFGGRGWIRCALDFKDGSEPLALKSSCCRLHRPKMLSRILCGFDEHRRLTSATFKSTNFPLPNKNTTRLGGILFGGRGWIRTTEAESSRFTVCPLWPLGNSPIFSCCGLARMLLYHRALPLSSIKFIKIFLFAVTKAEGYDTITKDG